MSDIASPAMNENLVRIPRHLLTGNLYAIAEFDEFLQNDTYLFLRTHNAEGSYKLNDEVSAFANIAQATSEFIGATLTADRIQALQQYWQNSFGDEEPLIAPVHSYIFLGKEGRDYTFQLTENGSNLMSIMSSIVFEMRCGIAIDFGFRQTKKVTRNASDDMYRLAFPVDFTGDAQTGRSYVVFDDHIKTGSTVANLAGRIDSQGGKIAGFMSLSNNPIVKAFRQTAEKWNDLRAHPQFTRLELFWRGRFGYGLDALTDTESAIVSGLLAAYGETVVEEIVSYTEKPAPPFYPKPTWWDEKVQSPEMCNLDALNLDARLIIIPNT